jgi:hypothetical protein
MSTINHSRRQHLHPSSSSSTQKSKVPFFVLHLPDGRAKALFTVPTDLAEVLVLHPIMARGACFELQVDVVSQGRRRAGNENALLDHNGDTSFLSTEFVSPRPEETALAIAERIAIRMGSPTAATSAFEGLFGMR